jgi:hypothetical protein
MDRHFTAPICNRACYIGDFNPQAPVQAVHWVLLAAASVLLYFGLVMLLLEKEGK